MVTGSDGFIGKHLCWALVQRGETVLDCPHSLFDFQNQNQTHRACRGADTIYHLAASSGGIREMRGRHAMMLADNSTMTMNILRAAVENSVKNVVLISSACVYPELPYADGIPERMGLYYSPVKDSEGYGWAKRLTELAGAYFAAEHGLRVTIARGFNAYGPGDRSSHVIPDLMRKIIQSKDGDSIEVWGGDQKRNLTYVADWVDALIHLAEHGPSGEPVNLAADEDSITIRELAERLVSHYGGKCRIKSTQGPIGHIDRRPNLDKLRATGWTVGKVSLDEGLRRTVEWWRNGR